MAIGEAVLLLVVADTIRVPEACLFGIVGKTTHIPTFRVVGDTMAAAGVLVPERGPIASSSFLVNYLGSGKKDENRRNFTDFKIVGPNISDLSWTWGATGTPSCPIKVESGPEGLSSSSSACSGDTMGQADSLPAREESRDLPLEHRRAQAPHR